MALRPKFSHHLALILNFSLSSALNPNFWPQPLSIGLCLDLMASAFWPNFGLVLLQGLTWPWYENFGLRLEAKILAWLGNIGLR